MWVDVLAGLLVVWAMHLVAASFTTAPNLRMASIQRLIAVALTVTATVLVGSF